MAQMTLGVCNTRHSWDPAQSSDTHWPTCLHLVSWRESSLVRASLPLFSHSGHSQSWKASRMQLVLPAGRQRLLKYPEHLLRGSHCTSCPSA